MKKLISIMLVLVLAAGTFVIAGCGNNENSSSDSDSGSSDQAVIRKAYVSSTAAGTLNTDSKGSDGDHNNMPPFRAVYIWYRIA